MTTEIWTGGRLTQSKIQTRTKYPNGTMSNWNNTSAIATIGDSRYVDSARQVRNRLIKSYTITLGRGRTMMRNVYAKNRMHQSVQNYFLSRQFKSPAYNFAESPWLPIVLAGSGYYQKLRGHFATACVGNTAEIAVDWDSPVKALASRLYRKASAEKFEGYTQAGEMLETLEMLKSPLSTLRGASTTMWHAMKRSTKGLQGKDLREAIAGSWLEWSFGMSPLIMGTAEIAGQLYSALEDPDRRYTRYKGGTLVLDEQSCQRGSAVITNSLAYHYSVVKTLRAGVNGGMWVDAGDRPLSTAGRLGLTSMRGIISQAYALLPLSFAIDWFIGVGPLLEECRPINGRLLSSWVTKWLTQTYSVYGTHFTTPWAVGKTFGCIDQCTVSRTYINRVPNIERPGSLQLGPLLFSLSQGMSAAALAAGPMSNLWKRLPWH